MRYDGTSKRVREVTVGFDVSMFDREIPKSANNFFFFDQIVYDSYI